MSIINTYIHRPGFRSRDRRENRRMTLLLQRTAGGWALLGASNDIVYQSDRFDARRRCLEQASALGVLRLTFGEQ